MKNYSFLTLKPIIYLANVSEEDLAKEDNEYVKLVKEYAKKEKAPVVVLCAKVEEELSELSDSDKEELLSALGIGISGLDKLIRATYDLLGLATYFTVGKDEVRAWTFKKGMNAKKCAGIIHTDFEKGFIKAEVMSYDDLIKYGSSLKTNKLVLVHGSPESKKKLSENLKEAISKNDKTYQVVSAFKDMIIHL